MSTAPELWQDVLIQNWEAQVQIDGGSISLDLDELLSDEMRRDRVRHLAEQAVNRATGSARRTGELFVALLGEIYGPMLAVRSIIYDCRLHAHE